MVRFQFGKYGGKNVSQIVVTDYSYIKFMLDNQRSTGGVLYRALEDASRRLNNFVPQVTCRSLQGCNSIADFLSIGIANGNIPRGNNRIRYGPIGISVSTEYAGCGAHIDEIVRGYEKASKHPIKFDTLLMIPAWPKWVRKDVSKVLLECAGFSGRATGENCERFLQNLEQRAAPGQIPLL